jgi:hypothetical protein
LLSQVVDDGASSESTSLYANSLTLIANRFVIPPLKIPMEFCMYLTKLL